MPKDNSSGSNGIATVSKWVLAAIGSVILVLVIGAVKDWTQGSRRADSLQIQLNAVSDRVKVIEAIVPGETNRSLNKISVQIAEIAVTQRDILRRLKQMEERD